VNRLRLLRFDLRHGLPTALRILRRELGLGRTMRVVLALLWRGLTRDPFRPLRGDPRPCPRERFTRHQLKPVLLLDGVLRESLRLESERVGEVLLAVVSESGARFVRFNVEHPTREEWSASSDEARRELALGLLARFGNAEAEVVEANAEGLGFDVSRCHFVDLCRRLDRPDLAPLFCAADSVAYGDPTLPVALAREQTLARGDARCAFRFRFR
jgi:hypothetical protein